MSAHVLLNLLNELRKRDKMRGLPIILSLFHNKFNKFNNTGARMLDSIYQMTLKLIKNQFFWRENFKILRSFRQHYNECHYVMLLICKPLVVYLFYFIAIYHSQTRRQLIKSLMLHSARSKTCLIHILL